LQDGEATNDFAARELEGEERELWWARSVEAWPDYADYQTKTDRILPVFLLEPV
jgi:deazaflavin-dependent oxidoreductase (nitroreductase family)